MKVPKRKKWNSKKNESQKKEMEFKKFKKNMYSFFF